MKAPGWTQAFEEWAEAFVVERGLPGMSVGVAEAGREVYFRGFGFADREVRSAITPDTIYGIGSITKSFTCLAVMHLVEKGRLSLDAPVTTYAPELERVFGERASATTLHHFMTHSSGMPPLPVLFAALRKSMEADPDAADDLRELDEAVRLDAVQSYAEHVDTLTRLPFPWLGEPGRFFSYSNDCYGLLGLIIERASGTPYERYVEENVLRPAGLSRTLFDAGALAGMSDVSTCYMRQRPPKDKADARPAGPGEVVRSPAWWSAPAQTAAGFLKSTARDLLRYVEIYQGSGATGGRQIVSAESVRRMTTPAMTLSPLAAYGYGLLMEKHAGLDIVQHSGGLKSISAFVMTVPQERLSVSVLINLGGEAAPRAGMAVLNAMLGRDPAAMAPIPAETELPDERGRFAGKFHSGESRDDVEVVRRAGGLALVAQAQGKPQRLEPVGDGYFVAGEGAERMWVRPLERDGAVFALALGSRIWPRRELWDATGYPRIRGAAEVKA